MKLVRSRADKTDKIVARFTRNILGLATKEKVPFSYVGNKGTKADEINRTMDVNSKVVRALLKK